MKGKFEFFKNGKKIGESYNRMVYDGMEYIMDFAFGIETWHSGHAGCAETVNATGHWNNIRYITLGYSADDNDDWLYSSDYALTGAAGDGDNMTGGTGISGDCVETGVNISHFPNLNDSYMSSLDITKSNWNIGTGLFYKKADRIVRSGRTVTIEATFTTDPDRANGNKAVIPTGTKIREMGIFLGPPIDTIAPSTNRSHRPSGMIAKAVRYEVSGGYIQDNPIIVGENSLAVRYTYGDIS